MALDEKAEENFIAAMRVVVDMPWKTQRDRILWNALVWLCQYFKLEIVQHPPENTPDA